MRYTTQVWRTFPLKVWNKQHGNEIYNLSLKKFSAWSLTQTTCAAMKWTRIKWTSNGHQKKDENEVYKLNLRNYFHCKLDDMHCHNIDIVVVIIIIIVIITTYYYWITTYFTSLWAGGRIRPTFPSCRMKERVGAFCPPPTEGNNTFLFNNNTL